MAEGWQGPRRWMERRLFPSEPWPELPQPTMADNPALRRQGSSPAAAPGIPQARQKSRRPSHTLAATHTQSVFTGANGPGLSFPSGGLQSVSEPTQVT